MAGARPAMASCLFLAKSEILQTKTPSNVVADISLSRPSISATVRSFSPTVLSSCRTWRRNTLCFSTSFSFNPFNICHIKSELQLMCYCAKNVSFKIKMLSTCGFETRLFRVCSFIPLGGCGPFGVIMVTEDSNNVFMAGGDKSSDSCRIHINMNLSWPKPQFALKEKTINISLPPFKTTQKTDCGWSIILHYHIFPVTTAGFASILLNPGHGSPFIYGLVAEWLHVLGHSIYYFQNRTTQKHHFTCAFLHMF